jgi:hypothetical protein
MTTTAALVTPGLDTFLKSIKHRDLESSIESLISYIPNPISSQHSLIRF